MSLNSSNQNQNKPAPCPRVLGAAFDALRAPNSFPKALGFLREQTIERLPAAVIRLIVTPGDPERVSKILDLVRSGTVAAQEVAPVLVYLLRQENPELADKAARILATLETDRMSGFIPIQMLVQRGINPEAAMQFAGAAIGDDAIIFNVLSQVLDGLLNSERANQGRMLSDARKHGWCSSPERTAVTLGALCSDCPELRRNAVRVLLSDAGAHRDAIERGMLESALAFSAPDMLGADVEPGVRNGFLVVCTRLGSSPALASIIMEAHELIQTQAARTNRAVRQDQYSTVILCSAAIALFPAEHREEPLQYLTKLLDGSGQYNFDAAISSAQLVNVLGREQGMRVLRGLMTFLGRHLANEAPRSKINDLIGSLGDVEGFDRFLYQEYKNLVVKYRASSCAEQRLDTLLTALIGQSQDGKLVEEAQPLLNYLQRSRAAQAK